MAHTFLLTCIPPLSPAVIVMQLSYRAMWCIAAARVRGKGEELLMCVEAFGSFVFTRVRQRQGCHAEACADRNVSVVHGISLRSSCNECCYRSIELIIEYFTASHHILSKPLIRPLHGRDRLGLGGIQRIHHHPPVTDLDRIPNFLLPA